MKFLLDENLSPLHAAMLRQLGHDAVSVVELGLSGAADPEVRSVAIEEGRVLVTLDGDFANIVRFPPTDTPGVIRIRVHPPLEDSVAELLRAAVSSLSGIALEGKLAVVEPHRIRIRG